MVLINRESSASDGVHSDEHTVDANSTLNGGEDGEQRKSWRKKIIGKIARLGSRAQVHKIMSFKSIVRSRLKRWRKEVESQRDKGKPKHKSNWGSFCLGRKKKITDWEMQLDDYLQSW